MSLPSLAVSQRKFTWFTTVLLMVGGLIAYTQLGQLEDPEFAIKNAVIVTAYPGASPEEVEQEVTDRLERAIQEMPQIKEFESFSRAGLSYIELEIQSSYRAKQLPQVWDTLRKKIRDAARDLPPGAHPPSVADDFGDVYGFLLAVYTDGLTDARLEQYADELKRELSLVEGVARVELWGVRDRDVRIEIAESRLHEIGITPSDIERTLQTQNLVTDAGRVERGGERWRVEVTGAFTDPTDIENLVIQQSGSRDDDRLLRIKDVATVTMSYADPPDTLMRFNGWPAIGLAISNRSGTNVVRVGEAIDARLRVLMADLPVGVEVDRISWQSDLVSTSINGFMINLIEAVVIVLIVLWVTMGLRVAAVVSLTGLVFTIVGTFIVMRGWGIDLQRVSLGALVVSMGMMVDNAIVVADGILVRLNRGMDRVQAAVQAASQPSWPLLGATVVAVMAFYPIYASDENAGEFCASLFQVIAISLLLSWVLSVTIAPLMCLAILRSPERGEEVTDPYSGGLYRWFGWILRVTIRYKWASLVVMVVLLIGSLFGMTRVDQMFFPKSDRQQFMVDCWMPEGTDIDRVSDVLRRLERSLERSEAITAVSTFIGQGPPRFYLPVSPERPYASYGQLIVNVNDYRRVDGLIAEIDRWSKQNTPDARIIPRRYNVGPGETWQVQARFSGPGDTDPAVLRSIAASAERILREASDTRVVRNNWRQRTKKLTIDYDQDRGRWASVDREDIAAATLRAFDGLTVGQYREGDKLIPITLRHTESERQRAASNAGNLQVVQSSGRFTLPLSQVSERIGVTWEDPLIWRWNRRRAITVQAVPAGTAPHLLKQVKDDIEAIELPAGYRLEWDGESRSSGEAQASLVPGVVPAVCVMALVVVGLFNAFRPPLVILCIVPFAMVGVTTGLLLTGQPFGFVALLGAMSLSGMMIKNAIVLLDEIDIELRDGSSRYQAVINSTLSRFRPVLLAAGTTILGVVPLLTDVFWVSMSVVIMFGLAVGAALTMVGIPVLYACFYGIKPEGS
ncbi:efflux RND transporter permease subunit [Mucisphaera calidilacus]|uniref:Efflux pump membrane transporter BepE n=1 Tax=Mucisphaera calidilacus TaxID=2527982 RepID=A0A518BVU0_9BACT|nr:efflux RND transporter permease subunit [Mucisphaera calidilacus]QDU71095.1 Efflux pump membrane transporter BepE [Mucisphaera calidilacus]